MSRDLDAHTIELLAATHEQQVRDTQKLYGQRTGFEQPADTDLPTLEGFVDAVRDLAGRAFDLFIVALVIVLVLGLTFAAAPTP